MIEILTSRMTLRPITISDLDSIHSLHSLPETDEFNTLGIPTNKAETQSIIEPWINAMEAEEIINYTFSIVSKEKKEFIGLLGLKLGSKKFKTAEVWYKIHPDHWNNGFAAEALHSILNFGFKTLHLHRIEAGCAAENIASIKVLEKVGMTREGRHRKILPLKSGWSDNFSFAILETDIEK